MRKLLSFPIAVLLVVLATFVTARTQNVQIQTGTSSPHLAASNPISNTNRPTPTQVQASLASLPEADLLIYINSPRIINEVLPKLLPAKDVDEMRKAFEDVKKQVGVDVTRVEYIVVAVRFKKPTADLNFQAPEFMVVASGDFSAESIMTLARLATDGKLREEKYGTRSLGLMTIEPLVKEAEKNPLLKSFTEMGIVSLNGNTIAAGTPAYLRAAADASDGKERISAATLNTLVRDTNALASVAATPWLSFAKSFGMLGTETNARAERCETNMGNLYAALTMDATNFMVRGAMNADNPDTAKIFSNLYSGIMGYAISSIPDASTQTMLKGLAITAEGNEVLLRADFPQQTVVQMFQQQMSPKKEEASSSVATPKAPVKKVNTTRRRTKRKG